MAKGQNKRSEHAHTQAEYAEMYGTSHDLISRMVRSGVNPDDAAAVDVYLKTRTHKRDGLKINRPEAQATKQLKDQPIGERALGISEGLKAFQEHEAKLSERVKVALLSGDAQEVRAWQDQWVSAYQQMYKAETALIDVQQKQLQVDRERNLVVEWSKVEIFASEMTLAIREALDAAPARVVYKFTAVQNNC